MPCGLILDTEATETQVKPNRAMRDWCREVVVGLEATLRPSPPSRHQPSVLGFPASRKFALWAKNTDFDTRDFDFWYKREVQCLSPRGRISVSHPRPEAPKGDGGEATAGEAGFKPDGASLPSIAHQRDSGLGCDSEISVSKISYG